MLYDDRFAYKINNNKKKKIIQNTKYDKFHNLVRSNLFTQIIYILLVHIFIFTYIIYRFHHFVLFMQKQQLTTTVTKVYDCLF